MRISKPLLIVLTVLNILLLSYATRGIYLRYFPRRNQKAPLPIQRRDEYLAKLPVDTSDILFIGDSETRQFEAAEMLKDIHIKNRGINGDITSDIINRLPSEIRGHPQKVFVQSGVNDILRAIPTDKIIAGYKTIISIIQSQSPDTKIFINGIFPLRKGDDIKIKQVNAKLEALCKVNSIVFIDNYTDMVDDNALKSGYHIGDSLHLNYGGYVLWATHLKRYL